eukprot:g5260.t1
MRPIPRVAAADLSPPDFIASYVAKRVPVVITGTELPSTEQWGLDQIRALCGSRKFQLASQPTRAFILGMPDEIMNPMIDAVAEATGEDVLEFFDRTMFDPITIGEYLDYLLEEQRRLEEEQEKKGGDGASSGLAKLNAKIKKAAEGSEFLEAILGVVLRPRYLNDRPLHTWCEALLHHRGPASGGSWLSSAFSSSSSSSTGARVFELNKYLVGLNLLPLLDPELQARSFSQPVFPRIFLGPANSQAYPMHKNIIDADVMLSLVTGRKEFAVFPTAMEPYLGAFADDPSLGGQAGGMSVNWFRADAFAASATGGGSGGGGPAAGDDSLRGGWRGTLEAGDVLYMPGEFAHQARNSALSLAVVNWFNAEHTLATRSVMGMQANNTDVLGPAKKRLAELHAELGWPEQAGTTSPTGGVPFAAYRAAAARISGLDKYTGGEADALASTIRQEL